MSSQPPLLLLRGQVARMRIITPWTIRRVGINQAVLLRQGREPMALALERTKSQAKAPGAVGR